MNVFLISIIQKWFEFLAITIMSLMSLFTIEVSTLELKNENLDKNFNIEQTVIPFEIIQTTNSKFPSGKIYVTETGVTGVVQQSIDNEEELLREMIPQKQIKGTGPIGEYVGRITGYTAECFGCSKVGNVACRTYEKATHSLNSKGVTYNDREFGEVAILAADHTLFPCGTIIKVTSPRQEEFVGVVLDTGSAMRNAWKNYGNVLIDLALPTGTEIKDIYKITSSDVQYEVERWGW